MRPARGGHVDTRREAGYRNRQQPLCCCHLV